MTTRQRWIVVIGILSTLVLSLSIAILVVKNKKSNKPPKPVQVVRKVKTSLVNYSDIEAEIVSDGRVLSRHTIDVIAEVQGKVMEGDIQLKSGASFRKGQLLAKIYDTDAVYTIKSRKSSFLNLLANILPDLKIDYPDSYQKWVDFFESIDINKNLPPLPETSTSQEKIFLASKSILGEYYSIKSKEEILKKYYIWAPYDGSFQEVMLEVGSVANPGSRIASILQTGQLEIEVPIQTEEIRWIRNGQKVLLKSETGRQIGHGRVIREAGFVDPSSQSINVYVTVLPGIEKLFAGQYLKVAFPGMVVSDAMEIPRNATFNGNEVYVVDSGYLAKKEINILKTNEKTIIFNGLGIGTELVTQPLANANANMAVQSDYSNVHHVEADSTQTEEK